MIISACMTISSVTFMMSLGKEEAKSPTISIKQLLISNSDFPPVHVHTYSNTFSAKSITHSVEELVLSECSATSPKFYVEILMFNVVVLGDRAWRCFRGS